MKDNKAASFSTFAFIIIALVPLIFLLNFELDSITVWTACVRTVISTLAILAAGWSFHQIIDAKIENRLAAERLVKQKEVINELSANNNILLGKDVNISADEAQQLTREARQKLIGNEEQQGLTNVLAEIKEQIKRCSEHGLNVCCHYFQSETLMAQAATALKAKGFDVRQHPSPNSVSELFIEWWVTP